MEAKAHVSRAGVFLVAAFAGLAAALTLTWGLLPDHDVVGEPASLKPDAKEGYILLVSMTYAQDGDLEHAVQRLRLLHDPNPKETVRRLAEQYISQLRPEEQRRSLAKLALALGADSVALRIYAVSPTPTATPMWTATPRWTATPAPTASALPVPATRTPTPAVEPTPLSLPRANYYLFEQVRVTCDQDLIPGRRLMIYVQDASGKGLPGVKVRVQWDDGQDLFFTGLQSADPGYAEYPVLPGKSYSVVVADDSSQVAFGLSSDGLDANCLTGAKDHFGAWRIIFRRLS